MSTLIERNLTRRAELKSLSDECLARGQYTMALRLAQKSAEHYRLAFDAGIVADEPIVVTPCYASGAFIDWSTRVLQSIPGSQFSKFDRHLVGELAAQIERQIIDIGTAEDILLTAING